MNDLELVSQTFASWNLIGDFLRQLDRLGKWPELNRMKN
jgi:hypothetical protein